MRSNILLPIEIENRELDYKLLLAVFFSEKNTVYLGQHDYLYSVSKFMTGGIYLGKNQFSIYPDGSWRVRHDKLKKNGFSVIHLDEEGIFWGDEENHRQRLNRRMDVDQITNNDYICTWGSFQKEHYQHETKALSDNIVVTGNPRFSLLTDKYKGIYQESVDELKAKYKNFILIPTAFGLFNNFLGHNDSFSKRRLFSNKYNVEDYLRQIDEWNYSGKTLCEFIKMITHLSHEYQDLNIVVRPHPSENIDIYNSAFSNFDNVFVEYSGEIQPWILASNVLIHDGCTTALEAYIANTPVINFQPFNDVKTNTFLTSSVSIKTDTIEGVSALIKEIISSKSKRVVVKNDAKSLFVNLNDNFDSFDLVRSVVQENITLRSLKSADGINQILFYLFRVKYLLVSIAKNMVRFMFKQKNAQYKAFAKSFPGFDEKIISRKIRDIEKILNKKISYKIVNKNLIIIKSS